MELVCQCQENDGVGQEDLKGHIPALEQIHIQVLEESTYKCWNNNKYPSVEIKIHSRFLLGTYPSAGLD
jgi:hypothetical protein